MIAKDLGRGGQDSGAELGRFWDLVVSESDGWPVEAVAESQCLECVQLEWGELGVEGDRSSFEMDALGDLGWSWGRRTRERAPALQQLVGVENVGGWRGDVHL